MDGQQGVPPVILLEKKTLQLGLVEALTKSGQGAGHLFADFLSFRSELRQDLRLFLFVLQSGEGCDVALELLPFLLEELEFLLVLPGFRRR
jgi:hypothetical protein